MLESTIQNFIIVFNLIFCIYLGLRNSSIKAHHVRVPGTTLFLKVVFRYSVSSRFVLDITPTSLITSSR